MTNKPMKMKEYSSFDDWKTDQSRANRELINELQKLISETAPHLSTTVKWGQGCWTDGDSAKIYIHTEDDHVQLGFYNGVSMNDPEKLLAGNGKFVRFVRVHGSGDIDLQAFKDLILQAVNS